uniref:Putative secreted protein n=1 Tax=Anopheles marajoara TaxID=58244 RepID=A0A2M4C8P8_9DIPT
MCLTLKRGICLTLLSSAFTHTELVSILELNNEIPYKTPYFAFRFGDHETMCFHAQQFKHIHQHLSKCVAARDRISHHCIVRNMQTRHANAIDSRSEFQIAFC